MNKTIGIWLIAFSLLSSDFYMPALSQVPVEISKEKVIISGNGYYIHTVKKGQTAYSIAKVYGISVQELTAENPPALYGLKEGQALRIPVMKAQSSASGSGKNESRYLYHKLKSGETVYAISRTYGVSETEILQSNPGIEINKLSVGSEIAVPKRNFMNEKQKFDQQEKKYIYHKVEAGETLSSIARKYNISLRELRKENRNLRFPKVGDYVRVPSENVPEQAKDNAAEDTLVIPEQPLITYNRPSGFTRIDKLKGSIDIAVLLPLYLPENSRRADVDSSTIIKGKRQYKVSRMPETWIYPRSLDFIEMYNGILLACDTLRSHGVDVTIHTYDIKSDTSGTINLIRTGRLADMDLIIGPVYSRNLSIVAAYAKTLGIPVVSPVSLINNSVLQGNPTLFMANSSLEVVQGEIAREASKSNNSNFIFLHSDTLKNDPDVKRFRNLLIGDLTQKMRYEDIRFREFLFYSGSASGNDSINRMSHALSENSENIVIIASEDPAVISETITILHGLSRKFNIRIFGYPSMMFIENLDPRLFFELNMLVFYQYHVDYSKGNVRKFNSAYYKKFLTMPLESSYAWIGYDIAYYFISGISIHGKDFVAHPEIHNPELLENEFEFAKKEPGDGFENQKIFKVRYTRDYLVKEEK